MNTHQWLDASHADDSEILRKWIPVVVPLCAVVLASLVFLIGWEVLSRY